MQALASFFACGQPLKTTHCVVFLTLSFESILLSTEKQNGQAKMLVHFVGGKLESQFELYAYCNLFYIKYFLITKHI